MSPEFDPSGVERGQRRIVLSLEPPLGASPIYLEERMKSQRARSFAHVREDP